MPADDDVVAPLEIGHRRLHRRERARDDIGEARDAVGGEAGDGNRLGCEQSGGNRGEIIGSGAREPLEPLVQVMLCIGWIRIYDQKLAFHGPTDRELRGLSAYKSYIISLITMFPDIAAQVDEIYWMGNEAEGYLASLRRSATGTHLGLGVYGQPTRRQCRIWGIDQYRIRHGRIVEQWQMFNEFDLLQHLLADEPI